MKVSLFTEYGALNSPPVFKAFEAGLYACNDQVVYNDMDADVAVIWSILFAGRMSGNKNVYSHYMKQGKPVVVIEVGMLKRNTTWRIGLNGINRAATWPLPQKDSRFHLFDRPLQDWKKDGEFVVIATQRPDSQQWAGMPTVEEWVCDKVEDLMEHTKRHIVVRPHPRDRITDWNYIYNRYPNIYFSMPEQVENTYDDFDFNTILDRAHVVVNHSSNPAVDGIIAGIPVISSHDSFTWDVSTKIENIENPNRPDREKWAETLAYCEWFENEIAAGIPWSLLKERL